MSPLRIVLFLVVVITITCGLHYYLWMRLVRDPVWPSPYLSMGTWLIVALATSIPAAFVASRYLPRLAATPVAWVAYVWMGAMFLLFVLLLPAELVRVGARVVVDDVVTDPGRRNMIARSIAVAVATGGAGLSALGLATALSPVRIKRVRVAVNGLPSALHGLRIIQLTDIHVGPTIGRDFVQELVRKTNALRPDVVAITGDLVDGSVAELGAFVEPLRDLRARHGVFFVTGNHEYYSGADEWIAFLESLGVRVLRNERVTIEHDGAALDVAGVDDWEADQFGNGHGADLERALRDKNPDRKVLLLAHQPRQIVEAAAKGIALQLSGHTHGGQIFPFNYLVRLQQPFVAGLHRVQGTALYVSSGTGYWGPPMRLGIPAEITHLELACES
ncbi:MAG: metallophosphoesterase [Sandaracinaceae bacterium]|nr:metallophosphoesterase [Sandaracinaceae bacterium]